MHLRFKIVKPSITIYVALHVSDATVSIIRSLPPLHMQPLVTYQITNKVFVYKS
jgi:hypothetical protein